MVIQIWTNADGPIIGLFDNDSIKSDSGSGNRA